MTNSKDEVLLAQRKLDKLTDPGKWGPAVAGTIEVGETYESNVYKEAEEEIGLTGFKFNIGPKVFNDANPDRKFFVQWFTCSCDWPVEKFKIQEDEVEKVEWSSETQLVQRLKEQPDQFIVGAEKVWQALLA